MPVKAKKLLGFYPKIAQVSHLSDVDERNFRSLTKGGNAVNDELYIVPVDLDSNISCEGFQIEHHQIIFSEVKSGIGRYYLVFRAIPLRESICGEPMYSHYTYKVLNYKKFMAQEDRKGYFDLIKVSLPTYDSRAYDPNCVVLRLPKRNH